MRAKTTATIRRVALSAAAHNIRPMPSGHEEADDYEGPPPRLWPWLVTGFVGLILVAAYKL